MATLRYTRTRTWRERWFTWPWHPFKYTVEEQVEAVITPAPRPRNPNAPAYARRNSWQAPAPRPFYASEDDAPSSWAQTQFLGASDSSFAATAPAPLVSGEGGKFDGGGASARWSDDSPSPAPAPSPSYESPAPSPSYESPAPSPSYDSSSSSSDSSSSSSNND